IGGSRQFSWVSRAKFSRPPSFSASQRPLHMRSPFGIWNSKLFRLHVPMHLAVLGACLPAIVGLPILPWSGVGVASAQMVNRNADELLNKAYLDFSTANWEECLKTLDQFWSSYSTVPG